MTTRYTLNDLVRVPVPHEVELTSATATSSLVWGLTGCEPSGEAKNGGKENETDDSHRSERSPASGSGIGAESQHT
jgi:hypothetical protein